MHINSSKNINILLIFYLFLIIFLIIIPVKANPASYLMEKVDAKFDYNGTLISLDNKGSVEVEIFNGNDVLQNIEIILSSTSNTNLNDKKAYSAVAASPSAGDKTKLYINTNESNESIYYRFYNAPIVGMNLSYWNEIGGRDLTPEKNRIKFKLYLNSSKNLNGVEVGIKAKKNTYGRNDSLNFIEGNASNGDVYLIDSDLDNFKDNLKWIGNLRKTVTIDFVAEITPGINYPEDELKVDIDSKESYLNYSQPSTFTGITFSDRFARGPVRQGVEIMAKTNWTVKGFIKNIAYGFIYYVDHWNLYKVGENTSSASGMVKRNILPGKSFYTEEYDTGIPVFSDPKHSLTKPPEVYYSIAFDWNVLWGGSEYYGLINERMNLPTLYQMDLGLNKRIDIIKNDANGRILGIEDEIKHLGHANIQLSNLSINLTGLNEWKVLNLKIFYVNNTNKTEITNYTKKENSGNMEIILPLNISEKIRLNDVILLKYNLGGSAKEENKKYVFGINAIAITKSGTPIKKTLVREIEVPGLKPVEEETGGGGAGGTYPEIRETAQIIKISAENKFITDYTIENKVLFKVIDTGTKGIRNPTYFLYLPEDSYLHEEDIKITLIRKGVEKELNIEIEKMGIKAIGKKNYLIYAIKKKTEPTEVDTLHDQDIIKIQYKLDIPLGTSEIITRAYGYNYYEDKYIFEDEITRVRREYWKLKNLTITESKFENRKIFVGKPVRWMKTIEIYNPNERSVKELYTTKVFDDKLNVKIHESRNGSTNKINIEKEEKSTVSFFVNIMPRERITYFVLVDTQPILEIRRNTNILEIKNKSVKISLDITIKNFAKYTYKNAYLELPIQNILKCNFNYSVIGNKTEIKIPIIKSFENKTIKLVYEEKPPLLKIYTDKLRYRCNEIVNITLLIVQDKKKGYLEIEINGPGNSLNNIYADIISLEKSDIKKNIKVELGKCTTGKYTIYGYYKSNFRPILISKESFFVDCEEVHEVPPIIFVILTGIIIILLVKKVYRKKSWKEEIKELKNPT